MNTHKSLTKFFRPFAFASTLALLCLASPHTVVVLSCSSSSTSSTGTVSGSTSVVGSWTIDTSTANTFGVAVGDAPLTLSTGGSVEYSYSWELEWIPDSPSDTPTGYIGFATRGALDLTATSSCRSPDTGSANSQVWETLGHLGAYIALPSQSGFQTISDITPTNTWVAGDSFAIDDAVWTEQPDGSYITTVTMEDTVAPMGSGAVLEGYGGGYRAQLDCICGLEAQITLTYVDDINFTPWD